jgi:hypothetical protein
MSRAGSWTVCIGAMIPFLLLGATGCAGYLQRTCQPPPQCIGPDLAFYGHKKTCWHTWPNLEWSEWQCLDAPSETLLPVPDEEIVLPPDARVEPSEFRQVSSITVAEPPISSGVPTKMPRRLPPELLPPDLKYLPVP